MCLECSGKHRSLVAHNSFVQLVTMDSWSEIHLKTMGTNSKAKATRAHKSTTEADRKDREACEKEEQYWRDVEGTKSHTAKKRKEDVEKHIEAATHKAKARYLAKQEEKSLEKSLKKPNKKASYVSIPVPKVTEAEPLIDWKMLRQKEYLTL
ncbi:uncharacterized protein LOC131149732 [Malania oleifera]|uniref:uncharacterized protein LOC131149732 n=1 Tax=Malania oleifera TaxID=397392 RepID=UPI0025ADE377|nr:uncharacterized protein LOC131149732 [Malania oleifera]